MIDINLLPRHQLEIDKQKWQVIIILSAVICPLGLVFALHVLLQNQADKLRQRVTSYREEMQSYQQLMISNQPSIQSVRDHVSMRKAEAALQLVEDVAPSATCLLSVVYSKNKLIMNGETRSTTDIERLVKKWVATTLVAESGLLQLSRLTAARPQSYRLYIKLTDNVPPSSMWN